MLAHSISKRAGTFEVQMDRCEPAKDDPRKLAIAKKVCDLAEELGILPLEDRLPNIVVLVMMAQASFMWNPLFKDLFENKTYFCKLRDSIEGSDVFEDMANPCSAYYGNASFWCELFQHVKFDFEPDYETGEINYAMFYPWKMPIFVKFSEHLTRYGVPLNYHLRLYYIVLIRQHSSMSMLREACWCNMLPPLLNHELVAWLYSYNFGLERECDMPKIYAAITREWAFIFASIRVELHYQCTTDCATGLRRVGPLTFLPPPEVNGAAEAPDVTDTAAAAAADTAAVSDSAMPALEPLSEIERARANEQQVGTMFADMSCPYFAFSEHMREMIESTRIVEPTLSEEAKRFEEEQAREEERMRIERERMSPRIEDAPLDAFIAPEEEQKTVERQKPEQVAAKPEKIAVSSGMDAFAKAVGIPGVTDANVKARLFLIAALPGNVQLRFDKMAPPSAARFRSRMLAWAKDRGSAVTVDAFMPAIRRLGEADTRSGAWEPVAAFAEKMARYMPASARGAFKASAPQCAERFLVAHLANPEAEWKQRYGLRRDSRHALNAYTKGARMTEATAELFVGACAI